MDTKKSVQYITVSNDREGQRIDNFLIAYVGKVPRSLIYRWLRKGEVRVNKKRIKQTYKLKENDIVRIPPVSVEAKISLEQLNKYDFNYLEKRIIYENSDYMIVNKPSGLAVHGGTGINVGLIEQLRVIRPNEKKLELVHRLDRDTSGCILVAKKYSILTYFHQLLRERKVKKNYHALVFGHWPKAVSKIDKPLKKFIPSSGGERFVRIDKEGKPSLTTISVIEKFENCTLVNASPHTGRTHQLRVHLQSVGHPILGDRKYSRREYDQKFIEVGLKRLFLHAKELVFIPPGSEIKKSFIAPYDDSLDKVIKNLKEK